MNATTGTAPTETDAEELRIFISEIARVSAQRLGEGWSSQPGKFNTAGVISGPYTTSFRLFVDGDEDLAVEYSEYSGDEFPELDEDALPTGVGTWDDGVYLIDADVSEGLDALAERVANAIRFVTGSPLI